MATTPNETPTGPRRNPRGRIAHALLRSCQLALGLIVFYLLAVLVGLIPVNNDFEPAADGVEIMITSTAIHADLVLPVRNQTMDWGPLLPAGDFTGDVNRATRVAFGWGNKEFYVDTRTWDDLKAGTVFRAVFWPSATCLHVEMWDDAAGPAGARKTRISHEQYRRLVEYVLGSFRRDESGRFLRIEPGAYGTNDAFYHAHGSYHAFNTCNCWAGRGLKAAGVRTGWFTPLPKTVSLYMPAARAD
ncbi:MAG TPA: TIGR02117 family protein [Urbifossiella sp.]|nr:TIGR02117 family protein [Urbifossiella sp.]